MPINNITDQQRNFIDSFCSRTLSGAELRLFNVKEGRVRLRDRIADVFNLRAIPDSELNSKYSELGVLLQELKLTKAQNTVAKANLNKLAQQLTSRIIAPVSIPGPIYEGW